MENIKITLIKGIYPNGDILYWAQMEDGERCPSDTVPELAEDIFKFSRKIKDKNEAFEIEIAFASNYKVRYPSHDEPEMRIPFEEKEIYAFWEIFYKKDNEISEPR